MGLFSSRQRPSRVEPPPLAIQPPETRSASRYSNGWGAMGAGGTSPGGGHLGENLSAVLGAVELISSAIAALPASIVVDTPAGRVPASPGTPGLRILAQPNPLHSWTEWAQFTVAEMLTHGNALSYVGTDGRGAPSSLTPVPWGWASPLILPGRATGAPSRLVFDVLQATPEAMLLSLPRRILDSEAFHCRARSSNGVIGISVFARAAQVLREGAALGNMAESLWRRGIRPSAVMTTPGYLTPTNRELAQQAIGKFEGAINAGKLMLLEGGWDYKQVGLSSVDAEFLDTRKFGVEEVARITRVPVGLLQPGAGVQPYADLIAALGTLALAPLVAQLEAEFSAAVLPAGQWLQLDMGALLRGSYSAMMGANAVAVQSGILTQNDARRAAGLPALPGGDVLRANGAPPSFPADAKGVPSLAPKPGPGGVLPNVGTNHGEGSGG